jgi:rhodanese-related sulfurtransferase
MKRLLLILTALVFVFSLTACDKGYEDIDNETLAVMLESSDEYQFVDVRTSSEFYEERIPGFTYNIDYYKLEDDVSLLEYLDKNIPVVIMCNSGNRSASAAAIFVDEGFITVYNLENGIQGWTGETE